MSIIQTIPWSSSLPIESFNRFAANFNLPPGQYGFSPAFNPANQDQIVINLNENYIYLIDRVSFSASIDEGVYLESVAVQPFFRFRYKNTSYKTYPFPFPGINYKDNLEFSFFFHSEKRDDQLLVTMEGILNQTANLVGVNTIFAQLSLVIYQIENTEVIRQMRTGRDGGTLTTFPRMTT